MPHPSPRLAATLLAAACAPLPEVQRAEGELVIELIHLGSGVPGEATLVVGPDGTSVLVDLGNDRHADELQDALRRHGQQEQVDHVLLTHFHGDHIGAFYDLFSEGGGPVSIAGSVFSRGLHDLQPGGAPRG